MNSWIRQRNIRGWFDIKSGSVLGLCFFITAYMALVMKSVPEGWLTFVGIAVAGKTVSGVAKTVSNTEDEGTER